MQAYEGFASVYDMFMEDTDYDKWVSYIHKIWENENFKPKLIADLGCGTGNVTQRFAKEGYHVIGIDVSEDMLSEAKQKAQNNDMDILYICQDMRQLELYGTVNCVLSLYDSLNYILEEEELLKVFRLVNNYLHTGGLFLFDMNTEYKFKHILGQNTFGQTTENAAYIWENYYDEEEKINEFYMNFFIEKSQGHYSRTEEFHYERAYSVDTIKHILNESGMEFVAVYDAYTFDAPHSKSQRLFFVAREVMKKEICDVMQEEK